MKIEHITNDYERKNKDYTRYLNTLKEEREDFQSQAEDILGEKVKLNIVLSF